MSHTGPLRRTRRAFFAAALLLLGTHASANDAALYGPEAPPGSAFIRVLNASAQAELSVHAGNSVFDDVPAWSVSEFEYLPAGPLQISAGEISERVTLQPSRFYTAVVDDRGLRLLDNEGYDNKLKALVILYNLTDASELSLRTVDGSTTIIDAVDRDQYGTRQVNAARARLAVFTDDENVAQTQTVNLSRGRAFSVFVVGASAAPRLITTLN